MLTALQKTEAMLFSLKQLIFDRKAFKVENHTLPYNEHPKLLGILLDENLTFELHIQMMGKKASRSLRMIREVKGIAMKVSTRKLLSLYT